MMMIASPARKRGEGGQVGVVIGAPLSDLITIETANISELELGHNFLI